MARDFWPQPPRGQSVARSLPFAAVTPNSLESSGVVETCWRRRPADLELREEVRRRESGGDQLLQESVRVPPVGNTDKRPVLPREAHPGVLEHEHQKACRRGVKLSVSNAAVMPLLFFVRPYGDHACSSGPFGNVLEYQMKRLPVTSPSLSCG